MTGLYWWKNTVVFVVVAYSLATSPLSVANLSGQSTLPEPGSWLAAVPPDSQPVQLASIFGLENCRSVQPGVELEFMYCVESSSVPNRNFEFNNVFPIRAISSQAALDMSARAALISAIPQIINSPCEQTNPDGRSVNCAKSLVAGTVASTRTKATDKKLPIRLAQATRTTQTGVSTPSRKPQLQVAAAEPAETAKPDEPVAIVEAVEPVKPEIADDPTEELEENGEPKLATFNRRVSINIDAFEIKGENPIDIASSNAIVNRYIGADKGIMDMQGAAKALENKFRDLGHNFYGVSFPPQDVSDGTIELLVTRYKIGNISVKGNKHYSDQNIIGSLPQLRKGDSPNSKEMVRSLALANQNSGKRTKLTLNGGEAQDEIDATLTVVDQKPMVLSTWVNNTGSDDTGNYRVGANISHRNLLGKDHVGAATFISSPQNFSELQQYTLNYRVPIYQQGGSVNLFAVKSNIDTGLVSDFFDIAGKGEVYGLGYTHILAKKGEYRHLLALQAADKLTDNDTTFMGEQVLFDIRSRPITLTYQASWKNAKGLDLNASISATQNLGGGGLNSDLAYELSRTGANQDWNKLDIGVNLQYKRNEWLYTGSVNYSFSTDRLITGEQYSIGGSASIRGMEERELRGDQGYRISLQAWAPPIAKTLRPILFLDAGHVKTNDPIAGELVSESVSSLGLMLNWNPSAQINAAFSYGYLLDGVDFGKDIPTAASRDGDSKAHFSLSFRY